MKKYLIGLSILSLAIILSGCTTETAKKSVTDGGIFKSTDFGENWEQKAAVVQDDQPIGSIGDLDTKFLVFDPKVENRIYLISNGRGVFRTDDGGEGWMTTSLSSGTYKSLTIDSINNNVIYVTQGTKIKKTINGMESWFDTYIEKRPGQKLISVIVNPFNSNILYAATTQGIIKSYDYGNTWELLDWQEPKITQLFLSHANSNVLYALTSEGIYKSQNGGLEWNDISAGLKEFGNKALTIYWFDFDPKTEYIIIGTKAGIFKSTDGALTWQEIPTLFDFKKIPFISVIYDTIDLSKILFSVDNILYKTTDGGKSWATLKSVKTSRTINYMKNDPYLENTLYLGTTNPTSK